MNYTLKQLSDALAAGQMSSRELTRDSLARIDALNPQLNAFITVDHDGALGSGAIPSRIRLFSALRSVV